jgi:hypothetical protein
MSKAIDKILAALQRDGAPAAKAPKAPKYQHTYSFYAQQYGKTERSIKRYAAQGLPLDQPELMAEYFKNSGRKTDEENNAPANPGAAGGPLPFANDEPAEPAAVELDETFFEGAGVLAAIERLKAAERERAGAYFQAIKRNQAANVLANRFKEWTGLIDVLRKLEKDAPEIRRANRDSIDRAETEAAIGAIFQSFRAALNNMAGRTAKKVHGLDDYDEIFEIVEKEVSTVLRNLVDVTLDAVANQEAQAARVAEEQREEIRRRREQEAAQ